MLNPLFINNLETIRKELHANPEVSEKEFETKKRIIQFLKHNSTAEITEVANTGVLAAFNGEQTGQTILIRGDIDALPIQEINTFPHQSKTRGVSHKCGHDGHTTILLGLAKLLSENPLKKGKVLLLFQPAEENGVGAEAVLADKTFPIDSIDFAFALHNLPGFEQHEIVVKENEFNSNVKSIIIKLHGKTAHAAEPEKGHNPAAAIADIINYSEKNTKNQPEADDFFLITPIYINMGDLAYGISAGYGEIHLTIRSWSTDLMHQKCMEIENYIHHICQRQNLKPEISWTQVFYANINHPHALDIIRQAAETNELKILEQKNPFKWGEDFGLFTQKYKGAMFGLGAGRNTPALHNPDYDFPDEIIPTGVNMFYQIIQKTL